jgi:hypothetical protein
MAKQKLPGCFSWKCGSNNKHTTTINKDEKIIATFIKNLMNYITREAVVKYSESFADKELGKKFLSTYDNVSNSNKTKSFESFILNLIEHLEGNPKNIGKDNDSAAFLKILTANFYCFLEREFQIYSNDHPVAQVLQVVIPSLNQYLLSQAATGITSYTGTTISVDDINKSIVDTTKGYAIKENPKEVVEIFISSFDIFGGEDIFSPLKEAAIMGDMVSFLNYEIGNNIPD